MSFGNYNGFIDSMLTPIYFISVFLYIVHFTNLGLLVPCLVAMQIVNMFVLFSISEGKTILPLITMFAVFLIG
jgi:hypothetical protein